MLTESVGGVEVLTENTSKGKVLYIEGPMLMATQKNRNGRIYPKNVLEQAVDLYQKDYISERRAIGELNHPEYPFPDPKKAAIMVESLSWNGDAVIGKARVLGTPDGLIIKELLEANFKLGVSTRGLGDIKKESHADLVQKFLLNAIDAVDLPSGQICYVNAVNESVQWVNEGGNWVQRTVKHDKLKPSQLEVLEGLGLLLKTFKTK